MMRPTPSHTRRTGFTLIEVLIAIAVIIILIAAIFAVGQQVITRQKVSQAQGVLASLDRALQEYQIENRSFPRIIAQQYEQGLWRSANNNTSPVVNDQTGQTFVGGIANYRGEPRPWLPNAAYFLFLSQGYENIDAIIAGIPSQFSRTIQISSSEFRTQIIDPWGNPVLFITPDNPLAQAIFGACPNDRPYFLSAGPDGHYGVPTDIGLDGLSGDALQRKIASYREDNLYSVVPSDVDGSFNQFGLLNTGSFR